jgi:hypothetical protein
MRLLTILLKREKLPSPLCSDVIVHNLKSSLSLLDNMARIIDTV